MPHTQPRRLGVAPALLLVALLLAPTGHGMPELAVDEWTKQLDPWSRITSNLHVATASDGDVGAVFQDNGDSLPYFAVNRDGETTWSIIQVDATHTLVAWPQLVALPEEVWIIVYGGANNTWHVHRSIDDGATWSLIQSVEQAWYTGTRAGHAISATAIGSRLGVALSDAAGDIKWYRSSDQGTSWDRQDVLVAVAPSVTDTLGAKGYTEIEVHGVGDSWVEIYAGSMHDQCASTLHQLTVHQFASEDAGAFWGGAVNVFDSTNVYHVNCAANIWDVAVDEDTGQTIVLVVGGTSAGTKWRWSSGLGAGFGPTQTTGATGGASLQEIEVHRGVAYRYRGGGSALYFTTPGEAWATVPPGELPTSGGARTVVGLGDAVHVFAYNAGVQNRFEVHSLGVEAVFGNSGGDFIWCSSIGDPNGAYDYMEDVGVIRDVIAPDIGIKSGYRFDGYSGNLAYAAKSWGGVGANATGSPHVEVWARIEAANEARSSVFRIVLSTIPAQGTPTQPVMDKGSGAGVAGFTGGMFSEHVEVQLTEAGNDWNAKIMYVDGGQDRQQIGASWVGGSPNTPTVFSLEANIQEGWIAVQDASGQPLGSGSAAMKFDLPATFSGGASWKNYWFVGYGVSSVFPAYTYVDDNVGVSTCVFDHACIIPPTCYADPDAAPGTNGAAGRLIGNDELNEDFVTGGGGDGILDGESPVSPADQEWSQTVDRMGARWRFAYGALATLVGGGVGYFFGRGSSIVSGMGFAIGLVAAVVLQLWSFWYLIAAGAIGVGFVATRKWF